MSRLLNKLYSMESRPLQFAGLILALISALFSPVLQAEALVLIQGYKGAGIDWHNSGVTESLETAGWSYGGELRLNPADDSLPSEYKSNHTYYTLQLNSDAPLLHQVNQLTGHISRIKSFHPGESLTLIGHSAGGVLARLFMVQNPNAGVGTLITIASPHLGTESAEAGLAVGQSPLGWMTQMLGNDTLNRSSGLYFDLIRERPGSLLFWLNRQQHPKARYVSVIRDSRLSIFGDMVVPDWSQDMNRVEALRGRAYSVPSNANHGLEPSDGELLINLLRRLQGA